MPRPAACAPWPCYRTHWTDAEYNKESAKQPLTVPVLALGGAGFLEPIVEQGMSALASNVHGEIIPRVRPLGHRRAAGVRHRRAEEILRLLSRPAVHPPHT